MTDTGAPPAGGSAIVELNRQLVHYDRQETTWMRWYYSTKVVILVLGSSIPVMTTFDAWPWVIAVVGGLIAVVEGMSQVWHFHDRYVAARVLHRGLDKERILVEARAGPYADDGARDAVLAQRIFTLFETYEMHVQTVLRSAPAAESART